jgi:hypothetical protein
LLRGRYIPLYALAFAKLELTGLAKRGKRIQSRILVIPKVVERVVE